LLRYPLASEVASQLLAKQAGDKQQPKGCFAKPK
jgi:hypothetical protein